ncbi:enoyl-CoA hydratase [bacterium LRH843]|nr:enoyl-CoA hydratase [bacterium LRH843]
MTSLLKEELAQGVILLTINRPDAANSLSVHLLRKLTAVLNEIEASDEARVIIFAGTGEKVFCAGADLKERAEMNENEAKQTVVFIRNTIERIAALQLPTIAALNGSALGGGLELALACDLRIGSISSVYGLTETSLAVIPGAGGTQRLPRLIGTGKAKEMIYTAAKITGKEARDIGLFEYAERSGHVLKKAKELALQIVENGPIALKQAKKAINQGMEVELSRALEIESQAYEKIIPTEDRREGLLAFKEKRKPIYKGK